MERNVIDMGEFFNLDNKFFQGLNKVIDCFGLSALWMICFIPLGLNIYFAKATGVILFYLPCILTAVPAGAATTGLYYSMNKSIRHGRGYVWGEFWHSFKSNFKQTSIITMILAALTLVFAGDGYIMYQFAKAGEKVGSLIYVFLILIAFLEMWAIYIYAYVARFENTIKQVLKNAALIAIGSLPMTLVLFAAFLGVLFIIYLLPFLIIILPALYVLLMNVILEKIFRKYMSEEDIVAEEERNRDFYN